MSWKMVMTPRGGPVTSRRAADRDGKMFSHVASALANIQRKFAALRGGVAKGSGDGFLEIVVAENLH